MRVSAERDRCIASGQCNLIAPEVFDQDDADGLVIVTDENPDPRHEDVVYEAARVCPAQLIEIAET
jgi:ferredoxin